MTLPQGEHSPSERGKHPRPLRSDVEAGHGGTAGREGGSGAEPDLTAAGKVVDALKSSADQEFNIAERLSGKAKQAFALAAGFFVVAQTVAFGSFESKMLSTHERHWMLGLAIGAAGALAFAVAFALKADSTYKSRDLPLGKLEDDLNAAYAGDRDVIGKLGEYYLGVVRTRRNANDSRRHWYVATRYAVLGSLGATVAELIYSLVSRMS